jgi:hypothetical protein
MKKYRIGVYKVQIISAFGRGDIWYQRRQGESFFAILTVKEVQGGYVPAFKVIDFENEEVKEIASVLFIHPCDCIMLQQYEYRSDSDVAHFYKFRTAG